MNYQKYRRFQTIQLKDRTWPDKILDHAPIWCSVDLRDGNQALVTPMNVEEKLEMFQTLVQMGFKEIEVGFPSSSQIEYDFIRMLIDQNLIPQDVTIQVLTQAREHLIRRTFECLKGLKKAIVHVYNSTSILQRDVVFHKSKEEIKQIAVEGVKLVKDLSKEFDGEIILEYSPESFTGTEMDYAVEVCDAVMDTWQASETKKVIINLPATVEMDSPNVYADQIEYVARHFKNRNRVILSLHPHNDRGCGVAAAELGMMAGADRIEGTLFGNGERTGNVDLITLAMNLFTHGVDPKLKIENINTIREMYERTTKMVVSDRHPYAGKLVFCAFSGSHQDAINKGMHAYLERHNSFWEVPYLPIDPSDLGRKYEPIVRINSQSGKGGIAFVLEQNYGYRLPKKMQAQFSNHIQKISEKEGELLPNRIFEEFEKEYINLSTPVSFVHAAFTDISSESNYSRQVELTIRYHQKEEKTIHKGNGPIEAVVHALNELTHIQTDILDYQEHSLSSGSDSMAAAYVEIHDQATDVIEYGVGRDKNISIATVLAVFSAVNRLLRKNK